MPIPYSFQTLGANRIAAQARNLKGNKPWKQSVLVECIDYDIRPRTGVKRIANVELVPTARRAPLQPKPHARL